MEQQGPEKILKKGGAGVLPESPVQSIPQVLDDTNVGNLRTPHTEKSSYNAAEKSIR